jgi:hypothetical protein
MSTLEVRYHGKWRSFVIQDGKSDVLRWQIKSVTGEILSFLGKQLQAKRLKPTSRTYSELLILARRCIDEETEIKP